MKVASIIFAAIAVAGVALLAWASVWFVLDSPTPRSLAVVGVFWIGFGVVSYAGARLVEASE